jgi:hypothetical protein
MDSVSMKASVEPLVNGKWRVCCPKCEYTSMETSDEEFAYSLLSRHCNTRKHKTNYQSVNRFTP